MRPLHAHQPSVMQSRQRSRRLYLQLFSLIFADRDNPNIRCCRTLGERSVKVSHCLFPQWTAPPFVTFPMQVNLGWRREVEMLEAKIRNLLSSRPDLWCISSDPNLIRMP